MRRFVLAVQLCVPPNRAVYPLNRRLFLLCRLASNIFVNPQFAELIATKEGIQDGGGYTISKLILRGVWEAHFPFPYGPHLVHNRRPDYQAKRLSNLQYGKLNLFGQAVGMKLLFTCQDFRSSQAGCPDSWVSEFRL